MKKIPILTLHGGMTFKNQKDYLRYLRSRKISVAKKVRWYPEYLQSALGARFKVIAPRMPLQDDAKYRDWKILFERYLHLLKGRYVLVGSSLGGIFLAKYLSEKKLKRKALSVYLVCPPFDDTLPEEDLAGGFVLKADLSLLEKNSKHLYLLFSQDDDVVPVEHAEKYRKKLKRACVIIYRSKNGHFNIKKFPEIVKLIKADVRRG